MCPLKMSCLLSLLSVNIVSLPLKCSMKLPVGWIWVMMGSSGTLGYVEFSEVVGGDLEVPPDEYFDLKENSSGSHLLFHER